MQYSFLEKLTFWAVSTGIIKTFCCINLIYIIYSDFIYYKLRIINLLLFVIHTALIFKYFRINFSSSGVLMLCICFFIMQNVADIILCSSYFSLIEFAYLEIAVVIVFFTTILFCAVFKTKKVPFCSIISINYLGYLYFL